MDLALRRSRLAKRWLVLMYPYITMSHRTQIILTDDQYARLKDESSRTGVTLGELIRRAIDGSYGDAANRDAASVLEASFGAWSDRALDGEGYVEGLRKGLVGRLSR